MSLLFRSFPSINASFRSSLRSKRNIFRNYATQTTHATPPKPPTGIKKLMQTYGYSALGVYLTISILDIPLCYLLVHSTGEQKIRELQDSFWTYLGYNKEDPKEDESYSESEEKSSTFMTEFAFAYALHKSLVFIRLPITAAITPTVVRILRGWGFNVGKLASAAKATVKAEGVNPISKEGVKKVVEKLK